MNILEGIRKMVYSGEEEKALDLVQKALAEGFDPQDIMDNGLVKWPVSSIHSNNCPHLSSWHPDCSETLR